MALGAKIRTLFRLFVLFAVLVAVALISAITTVRLTVHSGQENAPNLVGVPLDLAERHARAMGLGVRVEDRLFSEKYATGQVVSQVPAAGASTKAGQDVHVLVSLGPPRLSVPDVVGSSVRAAEIVAVGRGLAVGDVATVHGDSTVMDQVVAQDPPPATTEVRSPAVNLLVSVGEPPAAFVCPDFTGMRLDAARRAIEGAGFKVGQIVTAGAHTPAPGATTGAMAGATGSPANHAGPSGNVASPAASPQGSAPGGVIVSQSPPPGSKIGADAVFNFEVEP
ncbi:MAG TPA: PASTA domain-containing protein [Terriglobia bacterium]|nr:PASTA domain-containing protein [Terriglobia bacterium]